MPAFQQPLSLLELFLPPLCTGVLFIGMLLFLYLFIRSRETVYISVFFLSLAAFVFLVMQSMINIIGGYMLKPETGRLFQRIEQSGPAMFIFALPFWLENILKINTAWKKFNRIIVYLGIVITGIIFVTAFAKPSLFVDINMPDEAWQTQQSSHGRAVEGPVYMLRDAILGLLMLYTLIIFIIDMFVKKRLRYLIIPFIGILLAINSAVYDILSTYNIQINNMPPGQYARFPVGITAFIVLTMAGQIQKFIDISRRVAKAEEMTRIESEHNKEQNIFIKEVLKKSSDTIIDTANSIFQTISKFRENSQSQAAATEQVTATIEEINAGIDQTTSSTEKQSANIGDLTKTLKNLSESMQSLNKDMQETLKLINAVSDSAHTGENALTIMKKSMDNISSSSGEITGIVEIITGISDKINLLSLNASIEAARAGDAGRGFAVAAQEISKLAEQTASSIKNIQSLIGINENEILQGVDNISQAMTTFNSIITTISDIIEKAGKIPERIVQNVDSNNKANEGAGLVKDHSEQISMTMNEHKNSVSEIMTTISSINGLAQDNASGIQSIENSFRELTAMLEKMNKEIETH